MDIVTKLRVFFWVLVFLLWGTFMVDFLHLDMKSGSPEIRMLKRLIVRAHLYVPRDDSAIYAPETAYKSTETIPARMPESETRTAESSLTVKQTSGMEIVDIILPEKKSADALDKLTHERPTEDKSIPVDIRPSISQSQESFRFPPPPNTFSSAQTKHFIIYREDPNISTQLMRNLEEMHANLMMDLIPFSPWTRDERVLIYLFSTPRIYRILSGRPEWSGGASSPSRRLVYVLEDAGYMGIVAHELTHIYFDSFFKPALPDPLWLSEGMAVFLQTERGNSPPSWLTENLDELRAGKGFNLEKLMSVTSLDGMDEEEVKLWYAQCYSLVRFMMKMKPGNSFYDFCEQMRDGEPINQCLMHAYGMPFDRLTALESAWRYDLKTKGITGI